MSDGDLVLIPTESGTPFPLGRSIVWHDPRNRAFAALPQLLDLPDRNRTWYSPDVFDQLGSSCTMQSAVGVCRTGPCRKLFAPHWLGFDTEAERHDAYLRSQAFDPWTGAEPDYEGTSTDAAFIVLRADGAIKAWKWLFGFHEVKQWVMHFGPVSVGTNWYEGMFHPDASGFIRPTGPVSGGHAWRIVGYSKARHAFRLVNSWGKGWGQNGRAWIHEDDLGRLLAEQGEAVTVDL